MAWTTRAPAHTSTVALALGVLALAPGCGGRSPGERVTETADLLPADARVVLVVRDLASLVERLDVASLRREHPSLTARASTALRNAVGFDLLDPDSARAQGLDPARPLALALLDEPRGATLLVLPGDESALVARLDGVYHRRGAAPTVAASHDGVDIHVADRAAASYIALADHVLVLSGVTRPDARLELCRRLIDDAGRRALGSNAEFRNVRERLAAADDLLCYLAPSEATEAGGVSDTAVFGQWAIPILAFARAQGPHGGAGLAGRIAADRLTLSTFTALDDPEGTLGARPLERRTPDPFLERLASEPLLALQLNLDPEAVVTKLRELHPVEPDTAAGPGDGASPAEDTRLDPRHRELAASLTGRVGLLANRLAIIGSDLVLYAEGTGGTALSAVLDSMVAELRTRPVDLPMVGSTRGIREDVEGGVPFYRLALLPFADICAAVVADHLVVTTTRDRMSRIIAGRSSFLPHVPDARVRRALTEGKLTALYVDVAGFADALGALPIPQAEAYGPLMDIVNMFAYITMVGDIDRHGYATEIEAVAGETDVWPELIEALLAARGRTS